MDENVESYLSHNEDNADVTSNTFSTLQPSSLNCKKNELKGIFLLAYCFITNIVGENRSPSQIKSTILFLGCPKL